MLDTGRFARTFVQESAYDSPAVTVFGPFRFGVDGHAGGAARTGRESARNAPATTPNPLSRILNVPAFPQLE